MSYKPGAKAGSRNGLVRYIRRNSAGVVCVLYLGAKDTSEVGVIPAGDDLPDLLQNFTGFSNLKPDINPVLVALSLYYPFIGLWTENRDYVYH